MVNQHDQYDIVDWVESKEKNAICIYNDLGCYPFSSAPALCDKLNGLTIDIEDELNQLNDENKKLKIENKKLYDENIQLRQKLLHFYQLKNDIKYLEEKGVF